METVELKIEQEKKAFTDRMLLLLVVFGSLGVAASVSRIVGIGFKPIMAVHVGLLLLLYLVFLLKERLSYTIKTFSVLFIFEAVAVGGLWSFGLFGGQLYLLAVPLFAAIMKSSTLATVLAVINGGTIVTLGVLSATGIIEFSFNANRYLKNISAWLTVAVGLGTVFVALIPFFRRSFKILNENMYLVQKQRDELKKANHTQNKIFRVIAHDLRAPFNGLLKGLELISSEDDDLDDETKDMLIQSILKTSKSTHAMVEDLLLWSRMQLGEIKIQHKKLNLADLVGGSLDPYSEQARQKGLNVKFQLPPDFSVTGDEYTLKIVFRNLIYNAVKFTNPGGTITLSAFSEPSGVVFTIKDTGVGMTPETLENLFDYGANKTTLGTAGEKGAGFGLLICHEFLKENGCDVFVESVLGKGTKFSIAFNQGSA